jgi:pantoate--beta-alanine ligase
MRIVHTLADLRQQLLPFRHPAVVPTMGNLHAGHLALVQAAKPLGDVMVATIFVNRLQFGPKEDFDNYPRTLQADCAQLEAAGCDLLFAPSEAELYPQPQSFTVQPDPALAGILEGQSRPGFFTGVCTVVLKLLACTQARSALFGKKDYQQLLIIRQMVRQFALPVDVIGQDTHREDDGLAMSSRNSYLSVAERAQAALLARTLAQCADAVREGHTAFADLENRAVQTLRDAGWKPDYVAIRRQSDLQAAAPGAPLVVLGAARLGNTRLIDNLEI